MYIPLMPYMAYKYFTGGDEENQNPQQNARSPQNVPNMNTAGLLTQAGMNQFAPTQGVPPLLARPGTGPSVPPLLARPPQGLPPLLARPRTAQDVPSMGTGGPIQEQQWMQQHLLLSVLRSLPTASKTL